MFEAIEDTLEILAIIRQSTSDRIYQNIQMLLKAMPDALDEIITHNNNVEIQAYKNKTKLCASQLRKVLPQLILNCSSKGPAFKEKLEFMLEKVSWCFQEVLRVFNGGGCEDDTEPSGLFVSSMDQAVKLLSNESNNDSFKELIDSLLCQAITIAKISENEDYNEITAACKNVLVSVNSIDDDLSKTNFLYSLEILERKVNTAVLRLYLHVMSEPYKPLKDLVLKCARIPKGSKLLQDMKELELYNERIQYIGNFAVACTESLNTKLKVQCCLASLEFVEDYINPTAIAFHSNPDIDRREFFKFLTYECQNQLAQLIEVMDNIVDTLAFLQVVFEDLSELEQKIRNSFVHTSVELNIFLLRCYKLISHLERTDDESVMLDEDVKNSIKELKTLIKKLKTFSQNNKQETFEIIESIINTINNLITMMDKSKSFISTPATKLGGSFILNMTKKTDYSDSIAGREWIKSKFLQSPKDDADPLDTYVNKVMETPRKTMLYGKTPVRTPFKSSRISFDVSDILDEMTGLATSFSEDGRTDDSIKFDTARRLKDINLVDLKIDKLSKFKSDVF